MKALVLNAFETYPQPSELQLPVLKAGEVEVEVLAAGLNRRDYYITKGLYPGVSFPVVLGSDVCGLLNGDEVVINPNINWGPDEQVQGPEYHILGMPSWGGLAEYVQVQKDRIYPKPVHLSSTEAAALPLAGLTAYRALFIRGRLQAGERILINGIGGGVASLACLFALAAGAEVWVTSSSSDKLTEAQNWGVKGIANYKEEHWVKSLLKETGGFDLIIDSAGGKGFADLAKLTKPAARIVFYGGTKGKIDGLSPQILFWRQVTLMGSTMGSDSDFESMLAFVTKHKIRPVVDQVYQANAITEAFDKLEKSTQLGKLVVAIKGGFD